VHICRTLKKLLTVSFVIILLFFVSGQAVGTDTPSPPNQPKKSAVADNHTVMVYYFHGDYRCYSCNLIEALTRTSVEEGFSEEIEKGLVSFRAINVDEPENKHFVKDYRLYTKSVILSDTKEGKETRWKNLTKVWELLQNEVAFKKYVHDEIREYLQ